MIVTQGFDVIDFSGGITDNYISAPSNRYYLADNFFLTRTGKLFTRFGSRLYDEDYPLITDPDNKRINTLFTIDNGENFLAHSQGEIKELDAGWNVVATLTSVGNWTVGRFIEDQIDGGAPPVVVNGQLRVVTTAGGGYVLNQIYIGDSGVWTLVTVPTDPFWNGVDPDAFTVYIPALIGGTVTYTAGYYWWDEGTDSWVSIPESKYYTERNYLSYSYYNNQTYVTASEYSTPQIIYRDQAGDIQQTQAGIMMLSDYIFASIRVYTPGANSYGFAFVFRYDYGVGQTAFRIDSAPSFLTLSSMASFPMAVTPNFQFFGTPSPVYVGSPVVVDVYRTTANGDVFYFLQSNPVEDLITGPDYLETANTSDADLIQNALLYTEGDVLPYEYAPDCKYLHIVGNTGYYANLVEFKLRVFGDDLIYYPDTIQVSVPNIPWATPRLLQVRVGEEITGLSSADDVPLVFTVNSVFRLDGQFDETGRGAVIPQRISGSIGCISNQSIVKVSGGCFFAGVDGFYFTDGYNMQKISAEFNKRYLSLITTEDQRKRIQGAYDALNQRVWWTIQSDNGVNSEVDSCYILDMNFGLKDAACFTSASGGTSFAPSALLFYKSNLLRGDIRGYLLQHLEDYRSDVEIDLTIDPEDWRRKTIIYRYESPAFDFGVSMFRKWAPMINIMAKNQSQLSLQIQSNNDDSGRIADLSVIRFRGFVVWGDENVIWGDPDIIWNFDGVIASKRHFPAKNLRCSLKQIIMTNGVTIVENSDVSGNVSIDSSTKEITLLEPGSQWPGNVVEYEIAFEFDEYEKRFPIADRISNSVIEVSDPLNILPMGVVDSEWLIYGKPIDERLNLLSYTLHWAPLSKTQNTFRAASQGQNNA